MLFPFTLKPTKGSIKMQRIWCVDEKVDGGLTQNASLWEGFGSQEERTVCLNDTIYLALK